MKTILLTNKYAGAPLEIIQSVIPDEFHLEMLESVSQDELLNKAHLADYILASGRLRIDREVLNSATNLKMIQRTGVGLDSLDLSEICSREIPLYVNQGVNADSVAEHALLLILACLRRLTVINNDTKNGVWKKQIQGTNTRTLRGRTVGIIGMGNIGKTVARLLLPFSAEVLYYDQYRADPATEQELNIQYVELSELFEKSEVITLHCALTEESKHLVNSESIGRMKDGVIIVNTARGQLICEDALIAAVKSGKVGFVALDVFENEPLNYSELTELDNIITTPHIAGVTYDAFYQMMHDAMRNISLFDEGKLQEIEQYRFRIGEEK